MSDLWMNVDAALSEVPVNLLPLVDDTDFKTIEDALTYDQSGLDLVWNFVTTAGAMTQTAVTPTESGGDYDWSNQGNGLYAIEIPASGGASINNDTEGFGWFTGVATGVLPWRGPIIGFRAAAVNDALIDGGDVLDVNVTQWLGTAAATPTTAGVPEVDVTHWLGTSAATPTTAGVPEVDVTYIAGDDDAATNLSTAAGTMIIGTVDTTSHTPTSTEFETSSITEATANHYNGRLVIWTSGNLLGQQGTIQGYALTSGRGHFTITTQTDAPANGDGFIIV